MKKFIFLEHTADVKFEASGKTVEEAFENSALALKQTICPGIKVIGKKKKIVSIKKKDLESLLYGFLEEILYLLDAENFLMGEITKIKIDKFSLKATILGDDASEYEFTNSVKAITYNDMTITKEKISDYGRHKDLWKIQAVLDV
jgi:SHS2 domain-containing protein